MILMRILIYGAGVIGSLYAALFAEAGYDTSIYARGKRFEALRNNGLQYKKNQEVIKAEIRILGELWWYRLRMRIMNQTIRRKWKKNGKL